MKTNEQGTSRYIKWLLCIAAVGGLLYGIDVGIIAAALLYLGKTIGLTVTQTSVIVAAVLGGGMCSSLVAGVLADCFGRKTMMVLSGIIFVIGVGLIVISHGFAELLVGRLLQGMSGGIIAVVVPLYLAECLTAEYRGRGTAVFQFMLAFGIAIASLIGYLYTRQAELAISAAGSNTTLIFQAENHAWRGMFFSVIYPGLFFLFGSLSLGETPRWLYRAGRQEEALTILRRSSSEPEAQLQMREMAKREQEKQEQRKQRIEDSIFQRKYVIPFALACSILAFNQATGINSILGFLVLILRQAGMGDHHATQGDVVVKVLNCVMTLVAISLVDKKGRKFLLQIGTIGIVISLSIGASIFYRIERQRIDATRKVQSQIRDNSLLEPKARELFPSGEGSRPMALTVIYSYGRREKVVTLLSTDAGAILSITPGTRTAHKKLVIHKAFYSVIPTETTGWLMTLCIALFIASFSVGPGVVVWIALSELLPLRIRSIGMGVALLLNQGVSTLIAGVFLPFVEEHGYYPMFLLWACCTVIYFIIATYFLPETKGKTLEQIEEHFRGRKAVQM